MKNVRLQQNFTIYKLCIGIKREGKTKVFFYCFLNMAPG